MFNILCVINLLSIYLDLTPITEPEVTSCAKVYSQNFGNLTHDSESEENLMWELCFLNSLILATLPRMFGKSAGISDFPRFSVSELAGSPELSRIPALESLLRWKKKKPGKIELYLQLGLGRAGPGWGCPNPALNICGLAWAGQNPQRPWHYLCPILAHC